MTEHERPGEQGPKWPDWIWLAFSIVALLLMLLVLGLRYGGLVRSAGSPV
jgi:hypothetical protein